MAPELKAGRITGTEGDEKSGEHLETREQPHPPTGDYELTQCPAYGPVNRDTT